MKPLVNLCSIPWSFDINVVLFKFVEIVRFTIITFTVVL